RDADHPGPRPALALEADLDTGLPQECRCPPQTTRQRPRAIWPSLGLDDPLARHFPKGVQKVRRGARPLRLCGDHGAHRLRHWISLDDSVDSFISVARVS